MKRLHEQYKKSRVGICPFAIDWIVLVCYCYNLMRVTSCPVLEPKNTSLEKRCHCKWEGKCFRL